MKKLSKRLLAMLLVAVMVVAAIPFGAFADSTFKHKVGDDLVFHGETNADWQPSSIPPTAEGHTMYCKACSDYDVDTQGWNTVVQPHTYDKTTHKCSVCQFEHTDHAWVMKAGSGNASGHTYVCNVCGVEVTKSGHLDLDDQPEATRRIAEVASTCTTQGRDAGTHYDDCGYEIQGDLKPLAAHTWVNGICSVCGATQEGYVPEYKVIVRKSGSATEFLADGATVKLTDTELAALSGFSGANTLLGKVKDTNSDYTYYYNNLTNAKFVNLSVEKDTKRIFIDTTLEKESAVEEKIEVIFDNGRVGSITKEVGTWYFATSNLGYDDTWGTEQAKLKIYSADGSGQSGGGVCHDEIHIGGHKAVDDGGAVDAFAGGVLLVKLHGIAQSLCQSVLKALGSGIQSGMLHQLADANGICLGRLGFSGGRSRGFRGSCGLSRSGGSGGGSTCAGCHCNQQRGCQQQSKCFLHFIFFPSFFQCELLCSTGGASSGLLYTRTHGLSTGK